MGGLAAIEPFDIDQRMNLFEQLPKVDRLHQRIVVEPLGFEHVVGIDGVRRQNENCRTLALMAAQLLRDFPAVHFRHRDVEQDQIRIRLLDNLQAFAAACGTDDDKAERLQQIADELALHLVVVDHEDRLLRAGISAHAVFHGRGDAWPRHLREQKLHAERAALADLAFDGNVAAQDLGQQARDRQPKPRSDRGQRANGSRALEGLENPLQIAAVNADAGVLAVNSAT